MKDWEPMVDKGREDLNAMGTLFSLMWEYKWLAIPVVLVFTYETIYWTLLNAWCWIYGMLM